MGHWKNFEQLEENLTLDELQAVIHQIRKRNHEQFRQSVLIKHGNDIGEYGEGTQSGDEPTFEEIQRRAQAKLRGVDEEALEFEDIGIEVLEE